MMITLPSDSKSNLMDAICSFVINPPLPHCQPTQAWLHILGHANWALNVFPLLKPALNSSYNKVSGHTFMNAPLYFNKRMTLDLLWFVDQVEKLEGMCFLESEEWDSNEADLEIWGDASMTGLAFWAPALSISYIADPVVNGEWHFNIFFNEALVILTVLQWASSLTPIP